MVTPCSAFVFSSPCFSLKENLWRRAVHESPKLKKVTSTVAYDIQGASLGDV